MKRTGFLAAATILAACATSPTTGGVHAQVEVDSHLLLGDIALERQDRQTAAREFLAAAMLSAEPGPSERATRIAHELELTEQGLTAAKRWRELAPTDERPAWYLGVFETRANRVQRAIAEFETFIRSIDDRRTGFALVLEALADEPYTRTATAIMRALNETFPGVPAGQYALARLALRSGDFELALENAEAASQSNADWVDAQLLYARTLLVTGRTEDSLAIGAELAGRHDDIEVQLQYAELLLSAGRPREAETRLNEILDENPGLAEATRALAFLAMTEQRIEDAKRYFNDLRGEPNYRSEAFYYLGRLAETENDFFQAARSYARVTDGTHAVEAQLRTARILYAEQNDREGAVRHLRDFGEANPRFATDMLVAQAQLLLQMGQPDEAMQVLDEALASTPDDPALHEAHAQLYVIQAQNASDGGALGDAEKLLNEGLDRYPGNTSLRYSLALLYEDQDRNRKALDVLESLAEEHPDDAAILNAYGYLLTDHFNRHEEARDYIERALALNPDSAAIIDSMGWVLYKLGDYGAAADYLERAYRLEQDPEIAAHLVDVRWQLGQRDSARELLRQSLEANPDSRHLKEVDERISP
ncbi:MAG TPA: tetratricopeptide repeat protein [Gammaproteobacteria bacterium]|nr:tetratricopeptide repeat protein [Gammaproteobacteria bacterium]